MSPSELLIHVVTILEQLKIPYMLTGSWVSSLQGEPRSSHDIDLVIELRRDQAASVLAAFPEPDYYLSESAISEALATHGTFNLLAPRTGDKVDFWMLTATPFDHSRFARRLQVDLFGHRIAISTPEDTILAKLRWSAESGGSERQERDALRVYEVQRPSLDMEYLAHWVEELGLGELWQRLLASAID